jgi:hypothetical protein
MKKFILFAMLIGFISIQSCSQKTCPTYAKSHNANMDLNKCNKMAAYSSKR